MARGSKRKKPSRKTSKDDSDDSSYSISQSIPSEEEPLKEDEEEDVSSQDSQGDEYEEVFHDGELELLWKWLNPKPILVQCIDWPVMLVSWTPYIIPAT